MSGKLDRRRARARRIQRVILGLHARGYSVKGIARQAGVSTPKVERTLDNLLPAPATQPSQQTMKGEVMDTSKIRTEKDLLAHLKAQQQELDELQHELSERRAESASRRLDLAEHKIQRLSEQGLDYGDA